MLTVVHNYWQRYSGLLGVFILWTLILVAMLRAHLGLINRRPISYLGVYPPTHWLFSISLLLSAVLFIGFAYAVSRQLKIKNRFMLYFLIGQLGQIIVALVPDQPHSRLKIVHTIAGFTLAFSLPLLMREFALSQKGHPHQRLYALLLRFEQVAFVIGIGTFVFTKGFAPLGEILPTVAFDVWIIIVSLIQL